MHEGPIKQEFHYQPHSGVLTSVQTQASEKMILARNAELRKNPGVLRDLGQGEKGGPWGRQMASIPFIMFTKAIKDGYDLNNKDAKFAEKEMRRFLASTEGKMCMVQSPDTRIFTGK